MKSKKLGKSTSKAEVVSISPFGLWILVSEKEYFLPAKDFPWFKNARVEDVLNISLEKKHHIRWEDLDIDIDLNSIDNLEKYPLISKEN